MRNRHPKINLLKLSDEPVYQEMVSIRREAFSRNGLPRDQGRYAGPERVQMVRDKKFSTTE